MKLSKSIEIIKALADSSRLMIMHALIEKPQYVEELSERLDLAASTVSFHLKKLETASLVYKVKEQYYVMYHINRDTLAMTLRDLVSVHDIEKTVQEERLQQYRQKVIRTFFKDGILQKIPAQQKKRRIIFEEFVKLFEAGRTYSEQEVNAIISAIYEDYCLIRRELIDLKIMTREQGTYWLLIEPAESVSHLPAQRKFHQRKEKLMDRRKALKREYKQNQPPAGVFQITNMASGKIFIGKGINVNGKLNSHQAQLKMGVHRNKDLQQDWNTYGPEHFSFEVLDYLEFRDEPPQKQQKDLVALEELWLDKLRPYGEKGYNKRPK
jgi:predicted transcriptional regulator